MKYTIESRNLLVILKLLTVFVLLVFGLILLSVSARKNIEYNFVFFLIIYSLIVFILLVIKVSAGKFDIFEPFFAILALYSAYTISAAGAIVTYDSSSNFVMILNQYYFSVVMGLMSFSVGYLALSYKPKKTFHQFGVSNRKILIYVIALTLIFGITGWPYALSLVDPRNILSYTERIATLGESSPTRGLVGVINDTFLLLVLLLVLFKPLTTNKFSIPNFIVAFLLLVTSIMSGSKFIVILYALIICLFYHYQIKRISTVFLAIVVCILYPYALMISHVRNTIDLLQMYDSASKLIGGDITVLSPFRSGELIVPQNLMRIMYDIDRGDLSFSYGLSWLADLAVFVPKFIYSDRPLPFSEVYAKHYFPQEYESGLGFGSFMLMDGYYAFGVMGVVIIMFSYGALLRAAYNIYIKNCKNGIFTYLYAIIYMNLIVNALRTGFFLSIKGTLIAILPFILILYLSRIHKKNTQHL